MYSCPSPPQPSKLAHNQNLLPCCILFYLFQSAVLLHIWPCLHHTDFLHHTHQPRTAHHPAAALDLLSNLFIVIACQALHFFTKPLPKNIVIFIPNITVICILFCKYNLQMSQLYYFTHVKLCDMHAYLKYLHFLSCAHMVSLYYTLCNIESKIMCLYIILRLFSVKSWHIYKFVMYNEWNISMANVSNMINILEVHACFEVTTMGLSNFHF